MKSPLTSLLPLTLAVPAQAAWTLYCGSSCTNGTAMASDSNFDVVSDCTSLGETYEYCHMESDEPYYKAVLLESPECVVSLDLDGFRESDGLFADDCTESGSWSAFVVVLNL